MNRCRWFWLASRSLVGTLALSLAIPIVAQAQIFQRTGVAEGQSGSTVTFLFDVPPGKVLVVEHVSARVFVPSGQIVTGQLNCNAFTSGNFRFASIFLLFQRITFEDHERFLADQPSRCYVAGNSSGSELNAVVQRNPSDGLFASVDVSISGYLIDKP